MLKHRLTFGPVMILLLGAIAWFDQWLEGRAAPSGLPMDRFPPGMLVTPLVLLLAAMGAREVARILRHKDAPVSTGPAVLVSLIGVAMLAFAPKNGFGDESGLWGVAIGAGGPCLVWILGLVYAVRHKTTQGSIAVAGALLLIYVYMGLMPGFIVLFRREHPVWLLIWVLACVKSCDIGAFFTGTTIGKHKLIEWLSPKKTWEGLAGGMLTSGLVGLGGAWLLVESGIPAPSMPIGFAMGVLFGGLGQCGDLVASLLKRDAGVKDAGTSLPGFGGVLDLIDSPVLVVPIAFWMLGAF